jgi:hypothetical protein
LLARMQASSLVGYSHSKAIYLRLIALERQFCRASFNQQKSRARHAYKVSCLLLPSRALFGLSMHPRWYLFFAIFVNWESTGKLFKIQIICVECIIFKIRIICGISVDNFASSFDLLMRPVGDKLFKIRIICRISFDNFESSFWSLST